MLVVWKDGKLVYTYSVNDMTRRQKMVGKYIARRQQKDADFSDYTMSYRQPIASCSKWYSAALIMTFVDEGKLNLSDTVGKYLPVLSQHGKGGITVRQCLSHLTGINEPPLKESLKEIRNVASMDEAIQYPIVSERPGPTEAVILAGPTCDSADVLYEKADYQLPLSLEIGDKLEILATGAYTTTYSAVAFNGFQPLEAYYI